MTNLFLPGRCVADLGIVGRIGIFLGGIAHKLRGLEERRGYLLGAPSGLIGGCNHPFQSVARGCASLF
ncbi:hypothetical protein ACC772_39735, partial [Rhizobium ruizarguesonis]